MLLCIEDGNLNQVPPDIYSNKSYWIVVRGRRISIDPIHHYWQNFYSDQSHIVATFDYQPLALEYRDKQFVLVPKQGFIHFPRVRSPWWISVSFVWRPELHWIQENKQIDTWLLIANRLGLSRDIQILIAQFIHEN